MHVQNELGQMDVQVHLNLDNKLFKLILDVVQNIIYIFKNGKKIIKH